MLLHPSILILLLLLAKCVSSAATERTLAPYFKQKKLDVTKANEILKKHQHLWPRGALTVGALKESLEAEKIAKAAKVLKGLNNEDRVIVLDATLFQLNDKDALGILKELATHLKDPQRPEVMQVYISIYQPWKKTKSMIASIDGSFKSVALLYATSYLIFKAFEHAKYALMRTIFDAIKPEYRQSISEGILRLSFNMSLGTSSYVIAKAFILNDAKGKYLTAAMFRMLSTKRPAQPDDLIKLAEHPDVDSDQFAKIAGDILLNKAIGMQVGSAFASVTGSHDIPALNKHLKSKAIQKQFLGYFDIEVLEIEPAWSTLASTLKNRKGIWRREHKRHSFEQLEAIGYLPRVPNELISQYAA